LGPDDVLVLEKDTGTVRRIMGGNLLEEPVLDVNVANSVERGMLGIAIDRTGSKTNAFLYFTESRENNDGEDECYKSERGPISCKEGNDPLGNRLYRYELVGGKLVNPKLLLDLPAVPNRHNGGPVLVGADGNLYIAIGDVDRRSQAQNIQDGEEANGTGGILRVSQDGKSVGNGILSDEHPLDMYYAYGIRNSFGIDFDPVTGILWDTENGDESFDEINLVEPGFNSGWRRVMGPDNVQEEFDPSELVTFAGNGEYSNPEFAWTEAVGPTALKFLDSNKLGKEYKNDMFVGDIHNGNLYRFELNDARDQLYLNSVLEDEIADNDDELEDIIFGRNFGGITDIEVSPYDGYLYIVSFDRGKIFKVFLNDS
jgi:aldose sugar dehydrogenase